MSQPPDPLRQDDPREVGGWITRARLGAGGMGTVYLAARKGQVAAVKVISPALATEPGFRARFSREIELCGRVSAPNVARVLDADADGPIPWLAMQYVEGPTLYQRVLADGPLPAEELEQLAGGLALALQAMHRVGVVHRDLKPSNVILTQDGPTVIDFGVATAAEATSLTTTGTVVGSAGWMAPEQVTGAAVGPPTDVFSWAATVAFAATGRPPFGVGRSEAVAYRVVHEAPDLGGFTGSLGGLVRRCLQSDPDRRPTVSDLLSPPQEQATAGMVDRQRRQALPARGTPRCERSQRADWRRQRWHRAGGCSDRGQRVR